MAGSNPAWAVQGENPRRQVEMEFEHIGYWKVREKRLYEQIS